MRIISGSLKGRRLNPANLPVRPTTDLAKESIFNVINNNFDFDEVKALDLFTGTGSIAFEFVSRGCINVTAVDLNFKCIEFIKKSITDFNISNLIVYRSEVFNFLNSCKTSYDIIFSDPPYDMEKIDKIPEMIFNNNLLNDGGWLILEHSSEHNFTGNENFFQHRKYGKVNFSIFEKK